MAVPDADAGLHAPDFRSAERMYPALVDAAELFSRRRRGRLLVQTRFPDHHARVGVRAGSEELFLAQEQAFGTASVSALDFGLIRLDVSGTAEPVVAQPRTVGGAGYEDRRRPSSERTMGGHGYATLLSSQAGLMQVPQPPHILGPSPAPRHGPWSVLLADLGQIRMPLRPEVLVLETR